MLFLWQIDAIGSKELQESVSQLQESLKLKDVESNDRIQEFQVSCCGRHDLILMKLLAVYELVVDKVTCRIVLVIYYY